MNPIQAAILGFIQGATEFIPVSSSAHLVILPNLFGWSQPPMSFDLFVHFGTLIALVVYFWPEFVKIVTNFFTGVFKKPMPYDAQYSYCVVFAIIPAIIAELLFSDRIEQSFSDPVQASWMLLGTAALLVIASYVKGARDLKQVKWYDSLVVGVMQAIAILPGISRSGATITGARIMGFDRESSAKFAFHVAIPAIGGAFVFSLIKVLKGNFPIEWTPSLIGMLVAAGIGYLSLILFFKIIKKMNFMVFAVYCVAFFLLCRYIWR